MEENNLDDRQLLVSRLIGISMVALSLYLFSVAVKIHKKA